jgi:rSAM/selenodomain-associated transferase 1
MHKHNQLMASRINIGVMARAPVSGHCKSRLAKTIGNDAAAKLYKAFLLDTLDILGAIEAKRYIVFATQEVDGLRVLDHLVSSPWVVMPQAPGDLTDKLLHASRQLSEDGGAPMLVGSDAPLLNGRALGQAASGMKPGAVAIGPATDGGYYLIASDQHHSALFEDMPWSTDSVARVTRQRCAALGLNIVELPESYDIDTQEQLHRLISDLKTDTRSASHTRAALHELGLL